VEYVGGGDWVGGGDRRRGSWVGGERRAAEGLVRPALRRRRQRGEVGGCRSWYCLADEVLVLARSKSWFAFSRVKFGIKFQIARDFNFQLDMRLFFFLMTNLQLVTYDKNLHIYFDFHVPMTYYNTNEKKSHVKSTLSTKSWELDVAGPMGQGFDSNCTRNGQNSYSRLNIPDS
jgi:hypothetical protein